MKEINLKSDTVTQPTDAMRKAMFEAEVGDDVYHDDPSVARLQELAADVTGKEKALFFPSGTMGNLVGLMCHAKHGEEAILEENAHMFANEGGGVVAVAGVSPRLVRGENGIMNPKDVRAAFRDGNIHYPKTVVICVENTSNAGGGTVYPMEHLREIRKIADEKHVKVHMDGARIFNAAAYLDVSVKEIAGYADSVMFCISKGLSAPIGSLLCGTKDLIAEAIRIRKRLGGGMRQAGIVAAAGILAITEMPKRLKEDHENAYLLAENIGKNPYISLKLETVQTNILYFDVIGKLSAPQLAQGLEKGYGVRCNVINNTKIRMVTNRHISREDIMLTVNGIDNLLR